MALVALAVLAGCDAGGSSGDPEAPPPDILERVPAPRGKTPDLAEADASFAAVHHSGSGVCAECHNDDAMIVPDPSGEPRNVSIEAAWRTSTMANAARDPYWHAVVASEIDDFPMLEDEINDKCTVCHAPMANDLAKKEGLDLRVFSERDELGEIVAQGLYDGTSEDPLFDHAMDGVSCSLCHQIDPGNIGDESSFTGGFQIVDARGIDARPAYGPYANPNAAYMQQQSGFQALEGAHMSDSATCATCHNLNVDPVDASGTPIGGQHFAEQASYTEWQLSDYATGGPLEASCQDCHMPEVDTPVLLGESGPIGALKRENFSEHVFLGANTVMQSMMRDYAEELGIPANLDFDQSIERNRAFLQGSAALTLENVARRELAPGEIEPDADGDIDGDGEDDPQAERGPQDELAFDVRVENLAGHKLPSGYHSRRAYLHVLVVDEAGEQVWESGAINADGRVAGVVEDVDPSAYEPHYDVITRESEVQVYQSVVARPDGSRTESLLDADRYLKDNRLLPKGFFKAEAIDNPATVESFGTFGAALADDDFDAGADTVGYRIAVPRGGAYRVLVELRYQPFAYGHLQKLFLKGDRLDPMDAFRTIYDNTVLRDEVLATATSDL